MWVPVEMREAYGDDLCLLFIHPRAPNLINLRPVLALFAVGDVYVSLCKKKALTFHLARGEGRERYFGCTVGLDLMQRKVLASSHQH